MKNDFKVKVELKEYLIIMFESFFIINIFVCILSLK